MQKVMRALNSTIVNVVLAVVAVFWLIPTLGSCSPRCAAAATTPPPAGGRC
ncbi:hypothetical protein [Tessaracoccus coleopterorum]|uniref:hypothetical protein n=1 Tax=Tessaracoccus coleopterorum TaxID=2714950 RepID=UPI001E579198|nr:hypothetical protein [Tessaracoccus coleopterorum]